MLRFALQRRQVVRREHRRSRCCDFDSKTLLGGFKYEVDPGQMSASGVRVGRATRVGYAQEAILTGTVTDATGGVLPGVTVTAVHEATGNTFEGVTDERGIFRIPARIGGLSAHRGAVGFHHRHRAPASSCWSARPQVNLQMAVPRCRKPSPSPARRRCSTSRSPASAATSTRARCRSCRCRAATGRRWRCWRRATGRRRWAGRRCRTAPTCASSS